MLDALKDVLSALLQAAIGLVWPTLFFAMLAFLVRRGAAIGVARNAAGEVGTNLSLFIIDVVLVVPALTLAIAAVAGWMQGLGWALVPESFWGGWPGWATVAAAVFAGDFIGYWRHRFEHLAPIWPAHAVHHSDRAMTWTTGLRFHPLNRFTTALIDTSFLALLGFPVWALAAANLLRHYYGLVIHTDLPWTYGRLGRVFVSPAMHRWHHARDKPGYNFASIFSVFDQAFGTYYAPGPCTAPTGIVEETGRGAVGQLWHPFAAYGRAIAKWMRLAPASERS